VFITENEVNFLAFPEVPESLLIFGGGYGWSALRDADWLHQRTVHYWGDIDTHGFAILDQLRVILPHSESFLMDRSTLLRLRDLCTAEPTPTTRAFQNLRGEELAVLDCLRSGRGWLRLEQERIPFSLVQAALCRVRGEGEQ
jgi:hypothetical protein